MPTSVACLGLVTNYTQQEEGTLRHPYLKSNSIYIGDY